MITEETKAEVQKLVGRKKIVEFTQRNKHVVATLASNSRPRNTLPANIKLWVAV